MDTYLDSYIKGFSNYFNFKGIASRQDFSVFLIVNIIFLVILISLVSYAGIAFLLVITIPFCSVSVRRMHDLKRTGWWLLVPVFFIIFSLGISFVLGNDTQNISIALYLVGWVWGILIGIGMLFFKGVKETIILKDNQ